MALYTIGNAYLSRTFEVTANGVRTCSLMDLAAGRELAPEPFREYAFAADDAEYSSWSESRIQEVDGNVSVAGKAPRFKTVRQEKCRMEMDFEQGGLLITLCYELLPEAPGMRKYLKFRNTGKQTVKLSNLVFDDTCIAPGRFADCDFYAGTDDVPQSVAFTLEGSCDVIRCHNAKLNAGWLMGSGAPGVLRYFLVYPTWKNVINGCNMSSAPFARHLAPQECWVSPASLLALYQGAMDDPETETVFRSLVRQGLPAPAAPERVMYCSWLPFLKNVNEALCLELAERAAQLGFGYFVLDDGWFDGNDHAVDSTKFPRGLEPLARRVRELGMTFGLWLNVGTDYGLVNVPDAWYARRNDGKINRLGFDYATGGGVLCLGSGYRDFVIRELENLTDSLGVGYFKLDFSSAASPYGILPWGCHATNHAHHHGWEDSCGAMYDGMFAVRDALNLRHPEVIVDFSFEAFGNEKPSIAALELSRLHHATNSSALQPEIQSIVRVRKNFYRWAGKLPPERILNGLLALEGGDALEYLLTSMVGAPLVSGDLRKLSPENLEGIRTCTAAFNRVTGKGALTEFRLLADEPDFDAFWRGAPDGHGILCVFNHGSTVRSAADFGLPVVPVSGHSAEVPPGSSAMFLTESLSERQ